MRLRRRPFFKNHLRTRLFTPVDLHFFKNIYRKRFNRVDRNLIVAKIQD